MFGSGSVGGTIRYITNQPKLETFEGQVEAGINVAKGGDIGYDAKGALNIPIGNVAAVRGVALLHALPAASSMPSARPAGKNVNDGERYGGRLSMLLQPTDNLKITPRVVWQRATAERLQPRGILQPLRQPVHDAARRDRPRASGRSI